MNTAAQPHPKPSFSPYRKWGIGVQVVLTIMLVLAVAVMANYISHDYSARLHVSTLTQNPLSPLTVKFLETVTNQVKVTVYYDKDDPLYSTILDLLNEYCAVNSRIAVQIVDYRRDPGLAEQLQARYSFLASPNAKNLVIFDCAGRVKPIDGNALAQVDIEKTGDKDVPYRRRMTAFLGERAFTSMLIAVTNPKPMTAYFLQGHGEHPFDSTDDPYGYVQFASILQENLVRTLPLSLLGTNSVPIDCNLLIIAGPRSPISELELEKIDQYLTQGGRLLALFRYSSLAREIGLEKILAKWGVAVGSDVVLDPEHSPDRSAEGGEIIVSAFSKHPLVNPLAGDGLYLVKPRTVSRIKTRVQTADAPSVEEIAFSGQNSRLLGDPTPRQFLPLIVAVEKGALKGVTTERGTTRMVVVGDSLCLANQQINGPWRNRDFAGYAANWLLDRTQLLEALGQRPILEYKLVMTKAQLQNADLLLLGGMPGATLLLGGLVWLRRRR